MNYDMDLLIWDRIHIDVVDIRRGLLEQTRTDVVPENNVYLFVIGRSGTIFIDGVPYMLKGNALFHLTRNVQACICSGSEGIKYTAISYQYDLGHPTDRHLLQMYAKSSLIRPYTAVRLSNVSFFAEQFKRMADLWSKGSYLGKIELKQTFYSFLRELYRELTDSQIYPLEVDYVERAKLFLNENFTSSNPIQELASSLGVSRATLHDQFRKKCGVSPKQYLMELRMNKAVETMLSNREITLDEVAAAYGMRDKSYFSRVFKQKFGIAPGEYRRKHDIKENTPQKISEKSDRKSEYLLIENFDRQHRYYTTPTKIVCLDYSSAEICAALGASERIVGVASAEDSLSDCCAEYQNDISQMRFLPGRKLGSNVPDIEEILRLEPELIIGTAYSFDARNGIACSEDFERHGIHVYAMTATYQLNSTFESVYEDILKIGRILRCESHAMGLIASMRVKERQLEKMVSHINEPVPVFIFDSSLDDKAVTSGQSLESYMIRAAGGRNIFSDKYQQFCLVDWEEIRNRDPSAIIVHSLYSSNDGIQKVAYLKRIPEIADTTALREGRIYQIGIKKVFPGIAVLDTATDIARWLHGL